MAQSDSNPTNLPADLITVAAVTSALWGGFLLIIPVPLLGPALAMSAIAVLVWSGIEMSMGVGLWPAAVRLIVLIGSIVAGNAFGSRVNEPTSPTEVAAGDYTFESLETVMRTSEGKRIPFSFHDDLRKQIITLDRNNMSLQQIADAIRAQHDVSFKVKWECASGWTILRGHDQTPIFVGD